ncbi:ESF1 homolog [Centruroides vittatus]|uniref:ESF1 homolog n=1 Tax=Centruroides vittatus TaxID=120091 RepID=UPI003510BA9E
MDNEKDERFSNIWKDPRFKLVSKKDRKIQIDKRFQSMFTDDNFKTKFVDKRGRSIQETSTENLKKFYELTSSSEDEKEKVQTDEEETDEELDKSRQIQVPSFEGAESGSTTSEESDLEVDDDEFDHKWGELHNDAPEIEKPTKRIAVCNMNWDRIKAEDILVLLNSFKPPDGAIQSVKIYPSEYGMQRMKEEEINGPKELVEKVLQSDEEDETATEEGAAYHREKLRQYQISRLKYYFAIVDCDTPATASVIYKELDGMEYESSAVNLDLRFVPDDMTFEQEPTSMATSLPDMSNYKPSLFTTTALQQIQVRLTWDETNPRRLQAMRNAFEKGKEADSQNVDLSAFLASSSSSSDEDEAIEENISKIDEISENSSKKTRVEKYKELLQNLGNEGDREDKDMELEITWEPGLQKSAKELVKAKQKTKEMTPWEQYLQKRKEKKKKKQKEELSVSNQDSDSSEDINVENGNNFNREGLSDGRETDDKETEMLKLLTADRDVVENEESIKTKSKKKKKLKKKKGQKLGNAKELENFQVDVNDPRFSALYTSHFYNIEPADPHFRETEGMKAILEERKRRREKYVKDKETKIPAKSNLSRETENLVSSIKQNALFNKRKRK